MFVQFVFNLCSICVGNSGKKFVNFGQNSSNLLNCVLFVLNFFLLGNRGND